MGPREPRNLKWLVGLLVTVTVISAVVTLVAAGKLPCPVCGGSAPAASAPPRSLAPLADTAQFMIDRSQGPVPVRLTASLAGFGAGEIVTVRIESTRIASVQADPSGAVQSFPIALTASWASTELRYLTLIAQGETSLTVRTAAYLVIP